MLINLWCLEFGRHGKVKGIGTLNVLGMHVLHDVLYLEGLKADFISASQLCDQRRDVKSDKDRCVIPKDKVEFMVANKLVDNCYLVTPTVTCTTQSLKS